MRTDYEETPNPKKHRVKDCSSHANKDLVFKRINELKLQNKNFSMRSGKNDGYSSCSKFSEGPSSYELESNKPILPEIGLRGKLGEGEFELLRAASNRGADVF